MNGIAKLFSSGWWRFYFSTSLRWKLILPTLGLTLLVISLLTWFAASTVQNTVTGIYTQKARAVAALVTKAIVDEEYILYYSEKLDQDIAQLVQLYPDVYRITIYGKVRDNIRVITSSDPTKVGQEVSLDTLPSAFTESASMTLKEEGSRSFFRIDYPLYQEAEIVGVAQVDLSLAERDRFLQEIYTNFAIGGLLSFLALGGLLYVALRFVVSNPVYQLSEASERISAGDYTTSVHYGQKPLRIKIRDEISKLMDTFNAMVKTIREKEERLETMIVEDHLTGLYNRQHFDQLAKTEIERASRYNNLVSFLMVDIHGLDAINHKYGQNAGDETLKKVAKLLVANFRQVDQVFRYGGDEFIVIMPETNEEGTQMSLSRLEDGLKQLNTESDVTISLDVGYSTWISDPEVGWRVDKERELVNVLLESSEMIKAKKNRIL